jgi:hypothetical protein
MSMGQNRLDFGGDLSAARATPWFGLLGVDVFSLGIGWPVNITGTLAVELCDHGTKGVAGSVYSSAITTQPAGTANAVTAIGIQPKGALFGRVTWTPGAGNSGEGKFLTDDSGVAGTLPILGMP